LSRKAKGSPPTPKFRVLGYYPVYFYYSLFIIKLERRFAGGMREAKDGAEEDNKA
jgi:hypothetical protein